MNKSIASTQGQKNKRYSVKKPSIAHFFVSQSRLTDAVSVIFGELLSYEHPPKLHKGFSAGSYKDMTRVAWLNPTMWAELFMENRDYLLNELDAYIASLNEYKTALEQGDTAALTKLLDDGRRLKEEVDGR